MTQEHAAATWLTCKSPIINSRRMVIHIRGGKGRQDRDAMLSPTPAALRTMLKASCGQDAGWRKAIESNSFWYSWTVRGRACLKYINMVIINQVNTDIRFAEYSRHLDDQQPVSRAHRSATGWRSTALKPGNDAIPAIGGSPFEGKAFEGEGYYGAERSALELRCGGR